MRKLLVTLALLALTAGGGLFFSDFKLEKIPGLDLVRSETTSDGGFFGGGAPPARDTIRIASFNIQVFGQSKLEKPAVMESLTQIVRKFDIVAIQEIRSASQDVMPRFLAMINSDGSQFDFVLGPRMGRTSSKEQYAYLYNTQTIELDRSSIYTVDDPDDLLHRPPLVAGFRARAAEPELAFTFTLVNIHTDPDEVADEVNALDDVIRAVRNDGRGEDDIILLGDLNTDDQRMGELGRMPGVTCAISGMPSNTRGTKLYDNLVFFLPATAEFTGRAGVYVMQQEHGFTTEQALEVSDHQPVWADFSVYEGGVVGHLVSQPEGGRTTSEAPIKVR